MKKKINLEEHFLVPKHIKLSEEEAHKILEEYNVSVRQLPKISRKDPIAKLLGVKPNDIIKIIRKSPTIGESFFYRVVTDE